MISRIALNRLNDLMSHRRHLELDRATIKSNYQTKVDRLKEEMEEELAAVEEWIRVTDKELRELTDANRAVLMPNSKSVQLTYGILAYRSQSERIEVLDSKIVLRIARKLGIVRKIARPVVQWKLVSELFTNWLSKHAEYRDRFIDDGGIAVTPEHERLYIRSAGGSIEILSQSLSDPAIRIEGDK